MWSAGSRTTGAEHECWNCFKLLEKKNIHISVFLSRQSERSKSTIRLIVNHPEPLSHKIRIRSWSLTNTTHLNTSLSLSQRICTRTILGSGFSSFCVVLLMNQHQHNLLESVLFKLTWSVSFPFDSVTAPRTCSGPTRTQSSDYFTCWLLSGLNQQHLHFSNKKRSWEVFKLWKTKMVVRWRITWHDLDRSSVLLFRTRRRVSEDESWNIPP